MPIDDTLLAQLRKLREALIVGKQQDKFYFDVYAFSIESSITLGNWNELRKCVCHLIFEFDTSRAGPAELIPEDEWTWIYLVYGLNEITLAHQLQRIPRLPSDIFQHGRADTKSHGELGKVYNFYQCVVSSNYYGFWKLYASLDDGLKPVVEPLASRVSRETFSMVRRAYYRVSEAFLLQMLHVPIDQLSQLLSDVGLELDSSGIINFKVSANKKP